VVAQPNEELALARAYFGRDSFLGKSPISWSILSPHLRPAPIHGETRIRARKRGIRPGSQ
jgi:hypothetical protein